MTTFLKGWRGRIVAAVLLLACVVLSWVVLLGTYVVWQLRQTAHAQDIPFDRVAWQAPHSPADVRCRMQRDLEKNHLRIGMTRAEVVALLGDGGATKQRLSYALGFCHPFGVDGYTLELDFDAEDKLIRVFDIQH